ncbi:HAD family hydrolase [Microvirga terrae]|uniref:HAD family hydrolase n=1 Tax=Microvirga terrae TaxID=2740529 RepID=A0ABY5RMA4_9HYPH|nr:MULTISPECIES: HAD family hydrolase [Microvirga]MBQ0820643.1 HAD family hydrolase [Microvirga sp. HBU67558]UVF18029.1 HAD family hydrolase [Microvirga terrae]
MPISLLGLDADDTLWHNETFYRMTRQRFNELLADFVDAETLEAEVEATERRNLGLYGYGAKGFTLSMLETALSVSDGQVSSRVLTEILSAGREMLRHPVDPFPGVREALEELSAQYKLILITKGDLFHQESKLAASGLGSFFSGVEIVSEKKAETYARIFSRHGAGPDHAAMAGNSVRSDVLPALEAGSYAALIPYHLVWAHEDAPLPTAHPRFAELPSLADLPGWLAGIARSSR